MRFHDLSSLFRYAFRDGFRQGHKGYFMVAKGLSLSGRRGRIIERLRRYRDHDTDCCPSGRYMTNIWLWNGRSLVQGPQG